MARVSHLLRRVASYYACLKVPTQLAGIIGKKELVKALGTKDETVIAPTARCKRCHRSPKRDLRPHDRLLKH
ncbi:DUF6538 domain-containing protein [Shinella kummerowiae]|uniref:DUF6538 domain-containing protein n=1 Tax=Shinella kummerowiae TaxID=417745 RepID=UPI003B84583C